MDRGRLHREPPSNRYVGDPLLEAAWLGRMRLTRLLVEGGSDVNRQADDGRTALMLAATSTHCDEQTWDRTALSKFLLKHGSDPNIKEKKGKTILILVCQQQKIDKALVQLLLEYNADPRIEDSYGMGPLLYAARSRENTQVLTLLASACKARGKDVIIIAIANHNYTPEENVDKTSSPKHLHLPITRRDKFVRSHRTIRKTKSSDTALLNRSASFTHQKQSSLDCINQMNTLSRETRTQSELSSISGKTSCSREMVHSKETDLGLDELKVRLLQLEKSLDNNCGIDNKTVPKRWTSLPNEISCPNEEPQPGVGSSSDKLWVSSIESNYAVMSPKHSNLGKKYTNESKHSNDFMVGPSGKKLFRQGSGTQLSDSISDSRRGFLPALNVGSKPPIPGIGQGNILRKTRSNLQLHSTPEYDEEVEDICETQRRTDHPRQAFFQHRSRTVQIGELPSLMMLGDAFSTLNPLQG